MDAGAIEKHALYKLFLILFLFFFTIIIAESLESTFLYYNGKYIGRIEINLDENAADNGQGRITTENISQGRITTANIGRLTDALDKDATVAYISGMDSVARYNDSIYSVKMVLSGYNYMDFSGLEIVKGTFFSADSCKYGQSVAVISKKLAQELFSSYDILGEEFDLVGQKFKVIGIYKNKSSIISLLGSDGAERVYIPYESLNQPDGAVIKTVILNDNDIKEHAFKINEMENILKKSMTIDLAAYKISDYYNAETIISQFKGLLIFIIGLCLFCFIGTWLFRYLGKCFLFLRNKTRDMYFIEFLKAEKRFVVKSMLISAIVISCLALLWSAMKFKLYIPSEFVPQDNIFDIGFYAGRIKDVITSHNASLGYLPSQFETDFNNVLGLSVFLVICLAVEFLLIISCLKLVRLTGRPMLTLLKGFFPAFLVALTVASAVVSSLGLKFVFLLKDIILFIAFIFIFVFIDMELSFKMTHSNFPAEPMKK